MNDQQINSASQPRMVKIAPQAFASKYKSKKEIWRFMGSEASVYLPAYETVTIFHMRDLVSGRRRMIKTDQVKTINVPFFEGLSIERMLEWADSRPENVMQALPIVKRERDKLPRAYIANVIFTITGAPFVKWIEKQVNERNAKIQREADMIEMDSQIAAIYQASTAISGKYLTFKIVICPLTFSIIL